MIEMGFSVLHWEAFLGALFCFDFRNPLKDFGGGAEEERGNNLNKPMIYQKESE